jgi:hypothetical protein
MVSSAEDEFKPFSYSWAPMGHGIRFTANFNDVSLSCNEVQTALAQPIADSLGKAYDLADLREGLEQYNYRGLVFKNATTMGKDVKGSLKRMIPEIRSIYSMLDDEIGQETYTAAVRIAEDGDQASLYARERLVTMSARSLLQLCSEIDVPIDEVGLYNLKGGDDENNELRMYHLDELGADSEKLRDHLATRLFQRIDILSRSGVEVALVHRGDLSVSPEQPQWLQDVQIGSLKRPLEWDGDIPRWQVTFREGSVAHRRTVPIIAWAAVEGGWNKMPYYRLRKKIDFRGGEVKFDERTRTLTHYSTVLGAVMLGEQAELGETLEDREIYRFFGRGFNPRNADRDRRRSKLPLPPSSVAALPAVLATRSPELLRTAEFDRAEKEVLTALGHGSMHHLLHQNDTDRRRSVRRDWGTPSF